MALTREDILDAVRSLQEDDELLLEVARVLLDERVLRKLAARAPDVWDVLRQFILTEELLQLPVEFRAFRQQVNERFDRLGGCVRTLTRSAVRGWTLYRLLSAQSGRTQKLQSAPNS